jgi:methionyl-tRNA formyltransferase
MTAGTAEGRTAGPARTIFFGSGSFAVPILDAIADEPRLRMVAVVTSPDRPAGRARAMASTPVADRAVALGLPVLKPARVRSAEAVAELAALEPDLGVLADYGQIIPPALLGLPAHGILNVHPSLLPRHRGATPIPATIASGDREAGVSVIRMDAGIDTGPVVASRAWTLDGTETSPDLEARAADEGATMLVGLLGAWLDGRLTARDQGDEGATTTRPFRREDGRLDPSRPARDLERLVRAQAPWPGTFVETDLGRVAILVSHAADATDGADGDVPGTLVEHDGQLALATSDGRLVIDEAQREGRRPAPGPDFLRGQRQLVGTTVR